MKIFVKKFYGFTPENIPLITFRLEGSRNKLLRESRPGDRIVFVATETRDTSKDERGMILGMAEIGRKKLKTTPHIIDKSVVPKTFFNSEGEYIWPEAIPMTRAWRFVPPIYKTEVFDKERIDTQVTRANAILLTEEETGKILDLPNEKAEVPDIEAIAEMRATNDALSDKFPEEWKLVVAELAKKIIKARKGSLNESDAQLALRKILNRQGFCCAITNKKLKVKGNKWSYPSIFEIDIDENCKLENIRIVSKAVNEATQGITEKQLGDYIEALQFTTADSVMHLDGSETLEELIKKAKLDISDKADVSASSVRITIDF